MKQSYKNEIIIFLIIGLLLTGMVVIMVRFYQQAAIQVTYYRPILEQALTESIQEQTATPTAQSHQTSVPIYTPIGSTSPTPSSRPKASSVAQNPVPKCTTGVFYNNTCYNQSCIDLDAPNLAGFDGNQYTTQSRIFWKEQGSATQYVNEDYCDSDGQLVEYACEVLSDGQRRPFAISVSDSVCKDGKSGS